MRLFFLFVVVCCFCGCGNTKQPATAVPYPAASGNSGSNADAYGYGSSSGYGQGLITFPDHLESNSSVETDLLGMQFTDQNGELKSLKEFAAGKNLILVMTRGYTGAICPYCSTQVARLIANYEAIKKQNAQVVVVYPVQSPADTPRSDEFTQKVLSMTSTVKEIPFPILLDLELKGVDLLGIRKDLSKPATYILDTDGRIQFAYVGNTLSDRPSVQALIEQLERINSRVAGG